MNREFIDALDELEKDRGIDKAILVDAIEQALLSAYKKHYRIDRMDKDTIEFEPIVKIEFDGETGDMKVFSQKQVVEDNDLYDALFEIELTEAKESSPNYEVGDVIDCEIVPRGFGRIAAQTAKQVVVQKLREAERSIIYNEFINKQDEIITGEVSRGNKDAVYINLGRIEAKMGKIDQIPGEEYKAGQKIKVYITEVKDTSKGPQINVSRTTQGLIRRLFEFEVPEIQEGLVQIKSIAREAGYRTKMAVNSIDEKIDPIGSCVGPKGSRVKNIVDELKDEKIDIIKYSENPVEFISAALSPSQVISVTVIEEEKSAKVIVPDSQLSLAIGKDGQNARLAAKLTGWKIDIKSQSQAK
ncbi:MAG: transcription termination factor NusA [Peptostreptococcaceae bacterium]